MTTELAKVEEPRRGVVTAEDLMPVLDLAGAVRRRNFMVEVTRNLMVAGVDYGVIPGTGSKPTLLKPGAERLCTLFGLSPEFYELAATEDWDGTGEGHGELLFYYRIRCRLVKNGILLGEGVGSCNSRESRYRWRSGERQCPRCRKQTIIKGREEFGGGWLCFAKKGGCGAKFADGDAAIEGQAVGRILNSDIADQVNTIQKMAAKRALVAAVLIATNASEFYTQDVEDMEVIELAPVEPRPRPATQQPEPERPWKTVKGMINEFAKLHGRLGTADAVYYDVLAEYGVKHSNEFRVPAAAAAAYQKLLAKVRELEGAQNIEEPTP